MWAHLMKGPKGNGGGHHPPGFHVCGLYFFRGDDISRQC